MGKEQRRETHNVFDLTIKYLLQDTSSSNVVYLINALFERVYPLDSQVSFEKTESVQKQGNKLKPYYSDMLVKVAEDDFAIEFQIGDDEIIGLRIFEYGFRYAHKNKLIYENGALIELALPEGCVVFWEDSEKTPDTITVRVHDKAHKATLDYEVKVFKMSEQSLETLEEKRLLLLLPFCLVQFRKELKGKQVSAEKRRAIAGLEKRLVEEIESVLTRGIENGYISNRDSIMILESTAQMHKELYDGYEEFQEAHTMLDTSLGFRLKDLENKWKDRERNVVKRRETKIFDLLSQGYTPEEVKELLAEEDDTSE